MLNNLTQHVPSLELCKQLRDAGYPQESILVFYPLEGGYKLGTWNEPVPSDTIAEMGIIAAPLASELLERLPQVVEVFGSYPWAMLQVHKKNGFYSVGYWSNLDRLASIERGTVCIFKNEKLAIALSEMYLYLSKNNLLKESNAK